jgi:cation diffusion facilitator family transporter
LFTLAANAVIALSKLVAFLFTRSGSMLAETIHSAADCVNQVLLLVGLKRATRGPSATHPLGTGRASYFWSFVVALMLFFGGGVFSIVEGVEKVLHPEPVSHVWIGLAVLAFGLALEGVSLLHCVRELRKKCGQTPLFAYLRRTKDAELVVVTGENFAASVGLALAALALFLAWSVDPRFDGVGSILVGLVLVWVAFFLARKVKSLLLGERADPDVEDAVRAAAAEDARIAEVLGLITVQQGPGEVMLAAKIRLSDGLDAAEAARLIDELEARVRTREPEVRWQFIEIDTV